MLMGAKTDDIYAYQRSELLSVLMDCTKRNIPLSGLGEILLRVDEIFTLLHKINQRNHFSRKEQHALVTAGFNPELLFPELCYK